jgi:hypothetical protein
MAGLIYLLMCSLYFVCVGLDIAMFFLQVRLVLLWKNINWLIPFDNAGKSLVIAITFKIPQCVRTQNQLSEKGQLVAALVVFAIARIILGMALRLT